MRRVSRSAALHLSRCNRPPVVDREAAHEDALIIRGVKPRITGELPPPPPLLRPFLARVAHLNASSSSASWHGARFVFLLSSTRAPLLVLDLLTTLSLSPSNGLCLGNTAGPSHGSAFLRSVLFIALN